MGQKLKCQVFEGSFSNTAEKKPTERAGHPVDHHGRLAVTRQMTVGDVVHFIDGVFPQQIPVQRAV